MQFDYFTKDSPEHMAPFFSKAMLKSYFVSVWLLGLGLLLFWPKKAFYIYLQAGTEPFCTSGIYMTGALILSYISLRCGRGELAMEKDPMVRNNKIYLEARRNFLSYGLVSDILHTLLFMGLMMPFFLIAQSVSGAPLYIFLRFQLILFVTALLFRLIGFSAYLSIGRFYNFSYVLTRLVFIFCFFLSSKFAPTLNPLELIYSLTQAPLGTVAPATDYGTGYLYSASVSGAVLIIVNSLLVHFKQRKASAA